LAPEPAERSLPHGPLHGRHVRRAGARQCHLTGSIFRLNEDGSAPVDNPFFAAGAALGGEVGANIQKVFSYGHRNGFGMAFDPVSGFLWDTENADDAYSELNRIIPGMNGGWVQFAGPISRIADWKQIETTLFGSANQPDPLSADPGRLHPGAGPLADAQAPGRHLRRPGV